MFTSQSRFKVIHDRVVADFTPHLSKLIQTIKDFLKSCFVDGTRSLVAGNYSKKQAAIIIAASLPAIAGAVMITLPGVLFPTPAHQAFYYFAQTLATEPAALLPSLLGLVSSTLGLRVPLG